MGAGGSLELGAGAGALDVGAAGVEDPDSLEPPQAVRARDARAIPPRGNPIARTARVEVITGGMLTEGQTETARGTTAICMPLLLCAMAIVTL